MRWNITVKWDGNTIPFAILDINVADITPDDEQCDEPIRPETEKKET